MKAKTPHTRGNRDSRARLCRCLNKISSMDAHQVCSGYLGLEHAPDSPHILTQYLFNLGFVINTEKSTLSPTQDSENFTARLSVERVKVFRACLAFFQTGLRLLGLMASAILVVSLGSSSGWPLADCTPRVMAHGECWSRLGASGRCVTGPWL